MDYSVKWSWKQLNIFYQKDRYASDCESNVNSKAICYCHYRSLDQQILFAATVERNTKQEGAPKDTGLLKKIVLKTRDKNGDSAAGHSCWNSTQRDTKNLNLNLYGYEQLYEGTEEFSVLKTIIEGYLKNGDTLNFRYYAQIMLNSIYKLLYPIIPKCCNIISN